MKLLAPWRKALLPAFAAAAAVCAGAQLQPPNFVVILGEGHGWSSTSVLMDEAVPESRSSFVQTPNLEKLAGGGMRLANFYAASPRCTPSRASLLTGKSPAQLRMTFVSEGKRDSGENDAGPLITPAAETELPARVVTIAEFLKPAGYATAHFGKWHLGRANPSRHGFDENDGANSNGGPDNVDNPHPKQLHAMTARGTEFITRCSKEGRPFFLQLSHYAARQGGAASADALAAVRSWPGRLTEREVMEAATDYDLDLALGQILDTIRELGLEEETYVIFTTDHGSPGRNPPLSGGKGTLGEGGLRVPLLIRGPGIRPGSISHVRATGMDLFPTLAALAGIRTPLPDGIEGGSLLEIFQQPDTGRVIRPREEFVVHFPHYDRDPGGPASAIYLGGFKLVRGYDTGALRLYDLGRDPAERHDLAGPLSDKSAELDRRLSDYLSAVQAQMPTANPGYKSTGPIEPRRGRKPKANP